MPVLDDRLHGLLFGVRRSVRYHNRRRRFFDNLQRWKTWLSLVFGSTAMATLAAQLPGAIPLIASALVAAVSALDLVIGSTAKARLHADVVRRFIELERTITLAKEPSDDDVRLWTAQRLLIEADEPPIMRVLDILCQNELLLAMDYPRTELWAVPLYKRLLAPFMNISDESIRKIGEREAKS